MPYAIIEYVPEKGYSFIEYSRELNESSLEKIWCKAMPRGIGWRSFVGARILRGFYIGSAQIALSYVEVTREEDEFGRSGLLKAFIKIMRPYEYIQCLQEELVNLPRIARDEAIRKSPDLSQIIFKTARNLRTCFLNKGDGRMAS